MDKKDINKPSILILNNDCLLSIFSYLNVQELMIVERLCQRFEDVAQMCYRRYRELDFEELSQSTEDGFIKLWEAEEISSRVGRFVHVLKISSNSIFMDNVDNDYLPMSVFKHFENLRFIYLDNFDITSESCIEELRRTFPAIEYIVLDFCRCDDGIAAWLENLPKLQVVKFININEITGQCLTGLRGIKEIKLYNCNDLEPKYFEKFCEENPQIRKLFLYLDIIQHNNRILLQSIAKNLKNLESLVLWDICDMFDTFGTSGPNFEILGDLRKITRLRLCYTGHENSDKLDLFLENLSKNTHIECLNICCTHYDMQKSTLEMLGNFSELRILKLNYIPNCDFPLGRLSCFETLQELHLIGCEVTISALTDVIVKFKCLKLINLAQCPFDMNSLISITPLLISRTHVLEIIVNQTSVEEELKKEHKNEELENFIASYKGKLKLTINANKDGSTKRSFHQWEEWEGDIS
ncbi:uncharacterized protein LOC129795786 [Lutzomyia longipalpis]|uniref:uncharacterized protein LOC129795786 n=1 Tax=Lutzomyia longipalpis TaxID=7200 RepID=UPI0024842B63|nr:uncharacterized protein LOC129795786 [Lutzomyia longipalpis]